MKCPQCNKDLIWGGDHDYEDYGVDGEGIVSNYYCSNKKCKTDTIIVYNRL
jgi:hypothetical protein